MTKLVTFRFMVKSIWKCLLSIYSVLNTISDAAQNIYPWGDYQGAALGLLWVSTELVSASPVRDEASLIPEDSVLVEGR